MTIEQHTIECDDSEVQELMVSAWYSGERIVLKGRDGVLAALVPVEDLEVLEEMEEEVDLEIGEDSAIPAGSLDDVENDPSSIDSTLTICNPVGITGED
ncbi:MAG: hypothetical protein HKM07_04815 [Chlamydiae bacterium]|nr:hypothetical protein [Chlamydiota bacterium]